MKIVSLGSTLEARAVNLVDEANFTITNVCTFSSNATANNLGSEKLLRCRNLSGNEIRWYVSSPWRGL